MEISVDKPAFDNHIRQMEVKGYDKIGNYFSM